MVVTMKKRTVRLWLMFLAGAVIQGAVQAVVGTEIERRRQRRGERNA